MTIRFWGLLVLTEVGFNPEKLEGKLILILGGGFFGGAFLPASKNKRVMLLEKRICPPEIPSTLHPSIREVSQSDGQKLVNLTIYQFGTAAFLF